MTKQLLQLKLILYMNTYQVLVKNFYNFDACKFVMYCVKLNIFMLYSHHNIYIYLSSLIYIMLYSHHNI